MEDANENIKVMDICKSAPKTQLCDMHLNTILPEIPFTVNIWVL